jgi:hypothetical protein
MLHLIIIIFASLHRVQLLLLPVIVIAHQTAVTTEFFKKESKNTKTGYKCANTEP